MSARDQGKLERARVWRQRNEESFKAVETRALLAELWANDAVRSAVSSRLYERIERLFGDSDDEN